MKRKFLIVATVAALAMSMMTGCEKGQKLADTNFEEVTQDEIHEVAETYGLDENMVTEIVEELSEEQKIAKEVTPLVLDTIKACFPQSEDEMDVDWDFVEKHFKVAPGNEPQRTGGQLAHDGLEWWRKEYDRMRELHPNDILDVGGSNVRCVNDSIDEGSIEVSLSDESRTNFNHYNELVQAGKFADETLEEIHPEEVAIVTVKGTGYYWSGEPHNRYDETFKIYLVKFDGTWYVNNVGVDDKMIN